jgi:hypothetical protein
LLVNQHAVDIECAQGVVAGVYREQQAAVVRPRKLANVSAAGVDRAHQRPAGHREEQDPVLAGTLAGRAADRDQIFRGMDGDAVELSDLAFAHGGPQHLAERAAVQVPYARRLVVGGSDDEAMPFGNVEAADEGGMGAGFHLQVRSRARVLRLQLRP